MKKNSSIILVVFFLVATLSCTKDKLIQTAAETNGVLLAGAKGGSKTWKITSISEMKNGTFVGAAASTDSNFPACESDNVFKFSNNAAQDYIVTEGAINCNPSSDPDTIEKGSWAFTSDGKSLLIDGIVYPNSTQFSDPNEPFLGLMILAEGVPLKVVQLTNASMTLTYLITYNSDIYLFTLEFAKS